MQQYINAHDYLENMRNVAANQSGIKNELSGFGPRVLIVGGTDAGKSTLAHILCNYAVRADRSPILVDVDCGQNSIAIPGTVAALAVHHPSDPETGSYLATKLAHAPIAYFFGHASPSPNEELYKKSCEALSASIFKKMETQADVCTSGFVMNTCGWVDGLGYKLILNLVAIFKINVILVVGHERLFNDLKMESAVIHTGISVIKLSKSEGVVVRDADYRKVLRQANIHQYFYGAHNDLAPHSRQINFADLHLVKILSASKTPASLLPIGAKPVNEGLRTVKVTLTNPDGVSGMKGAKQDEPLLNAIIAISHAHPSLINNADALLAANVAGFLFVQGVDAAKGRLTVLSPSPGPLPSKVTLVGTIKWADF